MCVALWLKKFLDSSLTSMRCKLPRRGGWMKKKLNYESRVGNAIFIRHCNFNVFCDVYYSIFFFFFYVLTFYAFTIKEDHWFSTHIALCFMIIWNCRFVYMKFGLLNNLTRLAEFLYIFDWIRMIINFIISLVIKLIKTSFINGMHFLILNLKIGVE